MFSRGLILKATQNLSFLLTSTNVRLVFTFIGAFIWSVYLHFYLQEANAQ